MPPRKRPLYPGELTTFRIETSAESKRLRLKRSSPNVPERRAAARVSMSKLRRRKLEEFDYEVYGAAFAKRCVSMHVMC